MLSHKRFKQSLRHKSVLVCVDEPTNEEKNETVRESAIFVKLEMVYTDGKYGILGPFGLQKHMHKYIFGPHTLLTKHLKLQLDFGPESIIHASVYLLDGTKCTG